MYNESNYHHGDQYIMYMNSSTVPDPHAGCLDVGCVLQLPIIVPSWVANITGRVVGLL